jgi:hypothetical protein
MVLEAIASIHSSHFLNGYALAVEHSSANQQYWTAFIYVQEFCRFLRGQNSFNGAIGIASLSLIVFVQIIKRSPLV